MSSNYGCSSSGGRGTQPVRHGCSPGAGRGAGGSQACTGVRSPKWPGIYVIGLTGGIASGKSTVSEMLAELGAVIIDADRLAHNVTEPGAEALERIRDTFGPEMIRSDGRLDRHRLAGVIFHDDAARAKLNSIVHPLVMKRVKKLLSDVQDTSKMEGRTQVAIVDAPLLFEAGADSICDETWVVAVGRETQTKRLIERGGCREEEALSRIDAQMPLDEKVKRATKIIDNRGSIEETRQRVRDLWEGLKGRLSQ